MQSVRHMAYFVFGLAVGGFLGCQAPSASASGGGGGSDPRPPGSIVFPQPRLRRLLEPQLAPGSGPLPWYASRNDLRLTTVWGTQSSTVEQSLTRVHDRQHQHHGQVRDDLWIVTDRWHATETRR